MSFLDVLNAAEWLLANGVKTSIGSHTKSHADFKIKYVIKDGFHFNTLSKIVLTNKNTNEKYVADTSIDTHWLTSIKIWELSGNNKFAAEKQVAEFDWTFDLRGNKATHENISAATTFGDGRKLNMKGSDDLHLGKGRDKFNSGSGNDKLSGDQHGDRLNGGGGRDVVDGGAGNDQVAGGRGNDTLIGGPGGDTFVFKKHDDRDSITDYNHKRDEIVIDDALRPGKMSVRKFVSKFGEQDGDDFVLNFGKGDVLTIENAVKNQVIQGLEFG